MAIVQSPNKYRWFLMFDPSNSAFGVIAAAFCSQRRSLFILEELYAKDEGSTSKAVTKAILEKVLKYNPDVSTWEMYYDPAAKWFYQECNELRLNGVLPPGFILKKSPKREGTKEEGLSNILTLLDENRIKIASHCKNTIWEMSSYKRDKTGKIPKKNDNNIDNLRYLVMILGKHLTSVEGSIVPRESFSSTRRKKDNGRDIVNRIMKRYA